MATVERTEIFEIDINRFYDVVVDYVSYPEFIDSVSHVEVLEQRDDFSLVKYSLNLIKEFSYTLELEQKKPNSVIWTLKSSDIFKFNNGFWWLEDLGNGKTSVTYGLDVAFRGFVPKMVISKLVAGNLPSMMKSYYQRAL